MNLIEYAKHGNVEGVKGLLAGGADVHAEDGRGRTALWWASREGHVECAAALLDADACVDGANMDGDTPLHMAASKCAECVRVSLCRLLGSAYF